MNHTGCGPAIYRAGKFDEIVYQTQSPSHRLFDNQVKHKDICYTGGLKYQELVYSIAIIFICKYIYF